MKNPHNKHKTHKYIIFRKVAKLLRLKEGKGWRVEKGVSKGSHVGEWAWKKRNSPGGLLRLK
jgi:hypothetical protein